MGLVIVGDRGKAESWEALVYPVPYFEFSWKRRRNKITFTASKWTWFWEGGTPPTTVQSTTWAEGKRSCTFTHKRRSNKVDYFNLMRCHVRSWYFQIAPLPTGHHLEGWGLTRKLHGFSKWINYIFYLCLSSVKVKVATSLYTWLATIPKGNKRNMLPNHYNKVEDHKQKVQCLKA